MIWPTSNENAISKTILDYHYSEDGKRLAITNRMIKAVILHFSVQKLLGSDGNLQLGRIEDVFDISKGVWQGPSRKPCPNCGKIHHSW